MPVRCGRQRHSGDQAGRSDDRAGLAAAL